MARRRDGLPALRRLVEETTTPLALIDDQGRITYCNTALAELLGVAPDELIGQPCRQPLSETTSRAALAAAALAPPIGEAHLDSLRRDISLTLADGQLAVRRASFVAMASAPSEHADPSHTLVFIESEDRAAERAQYSDPLAVPDPQRLQLEVGRFRQQVAARYGIASLIGNSSAARRLRSQVEAAAASAAHVLVSGPRGSGREHVARVIHYGHSGAEQVRLITFEADALTPELLRSAFAELATRAENAPQTAGSILLCHVDALAAELQAVLEDQIELSGRGVRMLTTSEQPLEALASGEDFRTSLAATLGTVAVHLEPLTARREDIPALAQLLLEEHNAENGQRLGGFEPEAIESLTAYTWPGNVDELSEIVRAACAAAAGPLVRRADLPQRLRHGLAADARPPTSDEAIELDRFLEQIEEELIRRAVHQARGNRAKAARLLGITRPRLYRRVMQLGLEESDGHSS